MKFGAKIGDQGSIEALTKIIGTVAKLSKICVIRVTPDRLYFVQNESLRDHAYKLWVDIQADSFFEDFRMEGVAGADQQLLLFEVFPEEILRVLKPAVRAKTIKIRLTKKGEPLSPHLTFDVKLPATANGSRLVTHDIPIQIVNRSAWSDYDAPPFPNVQTSIILPPVKTLQKLVQGMKNMSTNYVVLMANNDGDLRVKIETDTVSVCSYFNGLTNSRVAGRTADEDEDSESRKEFFSVRLDIKALYQFLQNQQLTFCRLVLSILHHRLAHLGIEHEDLKLQYFVPAVTI